VVLRYVVTGAPGAGKTVLVDQLHARGYPIVREAATDVIAELQAQGCAQPWIRDGFCDRITARQHTRRRAPVPVGARVQFHDRSVLCTLALARYLGHRVPRSLTAEVDDVVRSRVFDPVVFLVRPLGFVHPTAARRISYEDSLVFEAVHEAVYREHGFTLLEVPPASPTVRADLVETWLSGRPGARKNRPRPPERAAPRRPTEFAAAGSADREDERVTHPDPHRSAAVSGDPAVTVRPAGDQDWPAVWRIVAEVVAEQETFPYDPAMSEADARSMWLVPAPGRTTVAVRDGRVLGTANMYANRSGPGSHIASGSFMVATPARGRGVGRALVEDALVWATGQGFAGMQFNAVVEGNTAAERLYADLGFTVIGTVPGTFASPTRGRVGLHVMFRPLP